MEVVAKLAATSVVGLVSIALGLQQVMKRWSTTSAENSVLTLLRGELERMSTQNSLLASCVNDLQLNANKLNLQLGKLQLENQKLQAEVICLTKEVVKLRTSMVEIVDMGDMV